MCLEALCRLDSLHYLGNEIQIFNSFDTTEAAKYFSENRLGFDYLPQKLWNFKKTKKEMELHYDPRLATSKRSTMPTKPKEMVTYKTEFIYHEPVKNQVNL